VHVAFVSQRTHDKERQKEKFCLSRISPTPLYFFNLSFLYLSNYVTYRFLTLQIAVILQLECGKNSLDFFVKFNFFKILKFNKKCLKKCICSIIKFSNYFSHILSQMFQWTAKFQIQILYRVRDTKKRSCLRGQKKTSTDLDAPINGSDRGYSWGSA
jgi:hypothetical protein